MTRLAQHVLQLMTLSLCCACATHSLVTYDGHGDGSLRSVSQISPNEWDALRMAALNGDKKAAWRMRSYYLQVDGRIAYLWLKYLAQSGDRVARKMVTEHVLFEMTEDEYRNLLIAEKGEPIVSADEELV